ncbi:MAG: 1,4-alpha-glucan branching protein GlgB [Nitrospirae bacterium]|nr:1,4-alpha-glucan branching protein GlgB [Nitrospirota bacterium]
MVHGPSLLTEHDTYLLKEGSHFDLHKKLGAHLLTVDGREGVLFAVWAPNAEYVSVIGDFNGWDGSTHPLAVRLDETGIWEGFLPGVGKGCIYKFMVHSRYNGFRAEKSDPMAFAAELRPNSASVVFPLDGYEWRDAEWMNGRAERNALSAPISIYEVHLGSWMRVPEEGNRWLTYRELAGKLAAYVQEMGFTHVELLPVMEHPLDASWGYQVINYFAPTSRFGSPHDFMYLVDELHRHGIGVILDWVPAHFPKDGHGLGYFDGTHLYEHADPRMGEHMDWGTLIFNFGRNEVRNFLLSNALFWLEQYHLDGLRVDAVASVIYLDYSRNEGEWIPNKYGGRENLDALDFLRRFNQMVYERHPDVITTAEESTAWPMVSRPTYVGGLGFGLKWNMGWMHDILEYMTLDPIYRSWHHNNLTFGLLYAFHENFILPFSHDEVVHGKAAMLSKMPGDDWQKLANLRLLYGFMFGHPGKKLMFMGGEFGQWAEWNHEQSLEWHLLQFAPHQGLRNWVRDLNAVYKAEPAIHEIDFDHTGFEWVDCNDHAGSVLAFLRFPKDRRHPVLVVCNFTPVPRETYLVGVPESGFWREMLNSDSEYYGGSGMGNGGGVQAEEGEAHGKPHRLRLVLPPLAALIFRREH